MSCGCSASTPLQKDSLEEIYCWKWYKMMCVWILPGQISFFFGVVFCPGTTGPTSWPTSLGSCPTSPVMGCWLGPMLYSTCWAKNARCSWCSWRWDGWELRAVEGCWSQDSYLFCSYVFQRLMDRQENLRQWERCVTIDLVWLSYKYVYKYV